MKRRLSLAEYEALSPEMKLLYVKEGDGYKLPLVDDDDPDALRRARDRERDEARDLRLKAKELQEKLDALQTEPARKAGDIATLERSWQEKLTAREGELNRTIAAQKAFIEKTLVEHAATKVASAVTAKPEHAALLMPHITSRFEVVHDGDTPTVKIKDKDGRISAMNFDEFQKELVGTPTFAPIVIASKASGGGATGQSSSNGGAGKKFSELSEPERVALYKELGPEEYRRRKDSGQ